MQCVNCQFENIPGVPECGRCGSRLDLVTAAIDIHPPRASRSTKGIRHTLAPLRRRYYSARDGAHGIHEWLAGELEPSRLDLPPWGVLFRGILPGWAHSALGFRNRGRVFCCLFWGLLAFGLFFLGTVPGSVALGLAVSVHASSLLDIFWQTGADFSERIRGFLIVVIFLIMGVYGPVLWTFSQFASPVTITMDLPPFHPGDVFLTSPISYRLHDPRPGDVVLYSPADRRVDLGDHAYLRMQGQWIDRIIAGPGHRVAWERGEIRVDGQRIDPAIAPLNPAALPDHLDMEVPAGSYCILPSTMPVPRQWQLGAGIVPTDPYRLPKPVIQALCIVPREAIQGRLYMLYQPLNRRSFLH